MFSIPFEFDVEAVPIDVQMEQWFLMVRPPPQGETNIFPGVESFYAL